MADRRAAAKSGRAIGLAAVIAPAVLLGAPSATAQQNAPQSSWVEELASAVVHIKTHINPEGRTVDGLGREREGSGIVIDTDGLVVTIGYLMVEALSLIHI